MNTERRSIKAKKAIKVMRNWRTSGEDKLTVDILKKAGNEVIEVLTKLFSKCVTIYEIPKDWENAITILLFKKGEKEDIRNYRTINLLSNLPKILMKVLKNDFFLLKRHTQTHTYVRINIFYFE